MIAGRRPRHRTYKVRLKSFFSDSRDTKQARRTLERDVSRINEPRKVLKSLDVFISAHNQHKTNTLTAAGIGTTSFSVLVTIIHSAISLSEDCPPGTNGASSLSCGLSAGDVVGAALGVVGTSISAKLLYEGRSHAKSVIEQMDKELFEKLSRVQGKQMVVAIHGQNLVSRFAQLNLNDQKEIREILAASTAEPIDPSNL